MRSVQLTVGWMSLFPAILMGLLPCYGQPANSATKDDAAKAFQAHAKEAAAAYEIRVDSSAGRQLTLQADPILGRWTNPVPERQMHGEVFLWTDDGRPAAVLCLFEMTENNVVRECHEFTSLASGPLVASGGPRGDWSPKETQITMSPLTGAPAPSATPRERLSQMRRLAAAFALEKTTRAGDKRPLRLLSQPVHRYASASHQVSDGALFAFVESTDPEAFLLLEARAPAHGPAQWHFGLARMASVQMRAVVDNKDKAVWQVDTLPYDGYRNRPDRPYATFFVP
jgi:hypothetical protein